MLNFYFQLGQRADCLFEPTIFGTLFVPGTSMNTLKIFLDDKSFYCLKQSIPPRSRSKYVMEEAVHLNFFGSNIVISCDEAQARNLLLYADHCPGVIAAVHKAFLSAGLSLDYPAKNA